MEDKLWENDGTAAERAEWKEKDELKAEKKQLVGVTNCNAYTIFSKKYNNFGSDGLFFFIE